MVVCDHPPGATENAATKRDNNTLIRTETLAISVLVFIVVFTLFAMNYQMLRPLSSIPWRRGALLDV